MKKTVILMAAAIAAFAACNKEAEFAAPGTSVTAFTPATKASVDGLQVYWTTGDSFAMFLKSGSAEVFTLQGEGPVTVGNFTSDKSGLELAGVAAFPAEGAALAGKKVSVTVPAEFDYGTSPVPMVGKPDGTGYGFAIASGAIRVSYSGVPENGCKLVVTADKEIAGTLEIADYDAPAEAAFAAEGSKTVTVTGIPAGDAEVTIPVAPGTYAVSVKLLGADGTTEVAGSAKTAAKLTVAASKITRMKAIALASASSRIVGRIKHLWIWGGTGPQYNCTKIYDLFAAKADNFDNTDGRGPKALQDNYLELLPDGNFNNWAGEDGRNWWFVYLQDGKQIDLTSFYDLLPRSTATWTMEGADITFTMPGGTTSQAKYMPAGTYDMPGTTPVKQLTLENPALMFPIAGGTDYWDNAASDLDVFVKHPRAMFVEFEMMADGFEIPAAAKTTDADFDFREPEDPGSPAPVVQTKTGTLDVTSLPGKWNVLGNNSTKNGIYVLGGSGSDPRLVCPYDKTWDWDDSVYRESDNEIVIEATGMTATEATGTINWWAGADGKFWNYKWMFKNAEKPEYEPYYGTDLSKFYNKIPKGKNAFTLDFASMTVTLSNGEKPKVFTPGEYKFCEGLSAQVLTVPDGCFALVFHLGNMKIEKTEWYGKDIDRFMFVPLEYIIIFEKTS